LTEKKSGVVFINKPSGITSFKSLDTIKRKLGTKKIGHTGTLDKFASGVMIVLSGQMTRLADYFTSMDKEYEAVFTFGRETSTLDPEGDVIAVSDVPSLKTIRENLKSFTGDISQYPPAFSAVHVNGKRAYELARDGKDVALKKRDVTVYGFEITDWNPPELSVRIRCSKGTYVRSLARDLGRSCGSNAFVSELARTKVGKVGLEDAVPPGDIDPDKHIKTGKAVFSLLEDIRIVQIDRKLALKVLKGAKLYDSMIPELDPSFKKHALFYNDTLIALLKTDDSSLRYGFVSGEIDGTDLE